MGTNYDLVEKPACGGCGRSYQPRHIGKSSAGWVFSFRAYPELDLTSVEAWRSWLAEAIDRGGWIENEYGDRVSAEDFWKLVEAKKGGQTHISGDSYERDGCTFHHYAFS